MKNPLPSSAVKVKSFLSKTSIYIKGHKKISTVLAIIIVGGGYYFYSNRSVVAPVVIQHVKVIQKDLVLKLSATGQVSAEQSVDLKAKTSGDVVYVGVVQGAKVSAGKSLVSLNAQDAQKAVRDAELSLKQAELDLQKAKQPTASADILAVEGAIQNAKTQKSQNAQAVARAYSILLNTGLEALPVSGIYADPQVPIISGTYLGTSTGALTIDATISSGGTFYASGLGYDYITGSISTANPQPIGTTGLYIKFAGSYSTTKWKVNVPNPKASGYLSAYNSYMSALQSQIDGDAEADRTIAQNTEKLKTLQVGTDPLDLASKELAVEQKQNALLDARLTLANYSAVAPFAGVVATLPVRKGDTVSSGAILATLISPTQVVQISVNEVDIPKIKIGQTVKLTFDALDGVRLSGHVIQSDTIGTVTSGVVTYKVLIAFDSEDERIKPNMTVNAEILIDSKKDALVLPVAAVKTGRGGEHYVEQETTDNGTTTVSRLPVTVGLTTDQEIEILEGLSVGDDVIVRKSAVKPSTTKTTAPSLFSAPRARG